MAVAGDAMAAYMIWRAFSWQLRLSPVAFPELCAALLSVEPTPLLDDLHVCVLRALAMDECKSVRNARTLDLALLDAVTWPEFVWEWLRDAGDPLAAWRSLPVPPVVEELEADEVAEKGVQADNDTAEAPKQAAEIGMHFCSGPSKCLTTPHQRISSVHLMCMCMSTFWSGINHQEMYDMLACARF